MNRSSAEGDAGVATTRGQFFPVLIDAVGRNLATVVIVTLATAILLGGLLGVVRLLEPSDQIFKHTIELTFRNSDVSKYPNEAPFSSADIIEPSILSTVYNENGVEALGLTFSDFTSGVSIQQYAPTVEEVAERYRVRLSDRNLTFTEKAAIELEMREEMAKLSRQNVMLTLIVERRIPMPRAVGQKILADIVREWSKDSIERRGVLKAPESLDSAELIDSSVVDTLDYTLAVDLIQDAVGRLRKRIETLMSFPTSLTLVDEKTGLNVLSLARRLDVTEKFLVQQIGVQIEQFGLSRDKDYGVLLLEARIGRIEQLTAKFDLERAAVNSLREGYRSFATGRDGLVAVPGRDAGGGQTSSPGMASAPASTVIPQLSSDFLDKLLALRDEKSDTEFLQNLAGKELKLKTQAIELEAERQRLQKTLAAMGQQSDRYAPVTKKLVGDLAKSIEILNEQWQTSGRIFDQLNRFRYTAASSLYRDLALPREERVRHPLERALTLGVFLAALFIVAALTLLVSVFKELYVRRD
ncbi:MAG: hypothetical protein KDJ37_14890 [Hyphomicrobiaceae bacterium]|nr:hypothetical protein [Hyphomicrobiaceae bacterium]